MLDGAAFMRNTVVLYQDDESYDIYGEKAHHFDWQFIWIIAGDKFIRILHRLVQ